MRILLVHNRYRSPGGEERHLELLFRSLTDLGAEVRLLVVDSGALRTRRSRLATALALPYSPASYRRVRDEVRRMGAEVVHFHNLWPLLTPAALHGARDAGARVVLTVHNYRFACPLGTLLRHGETHDDCLAGSSLACGLRGAREHGLRAVAYGAALELHRRLGWLERWVDAYVAPAEFVRRALARAGIEPARVHVIRHGVPPSGRRRPRSTAGGTSYALYAGRLAREKGIEVIAAAARLAPEVPIVVAGSGPLEAGLRLDRPRSLSLVGQLDPERVALLHAGSAMSLLPSTCHEVAPYSALEAAAAGKPVIASAVGGIPEIVADGTTGLLVPPGDPGALAAAMKRLWHDPDAAAGLGAQAALRVRRDHSLPRAARQHLSLYEELIGAA
jgi:glycosyltransferase involved in cell wall biosynthesis